MASIVKRYFQLMNESRSRLIADVGSLILRIGFGGMLITHGWGKLSNWGEMSSKFSDPIGVGSQASLALAIFAEFFCSIAVIFGLFTRLSVLPLITTMLVAAFIVHGEDPFQRKELALVYLTAFIVLLLQGPGRFSIDGIIQNRLR